MPLDPNIALQVGQPVQPLDPMKAYGQVLTLKNLMDQQRMQGLQLEKAQRDEADARGLRSAYAVTPEGEIDEQTTIKNLVGGGYGPQAVDFRHKMQTDKSAAAKAEREAEKARLDALDKTIGITGQVLSSLGPNPTYGAAMDAALWLNQQGVKVDLNTIPEDPQKLAQFVQQRAWQTMSAKEQIAERRAAMEPKTEMARIEYDYQRGLLPGGGGVTSEIGTDTANNPNATLNGPRVGFQSGGGNEMRDAALARAAYGPPPEGFRYVGRTQQLEPIPEVLAEKLKRAKASAINVNNYPPNALEPGKATRTDLEKSLIGSAASISRLNDIEAGFRPEYLQAAPRFSAAWSAIKEKGGANLSAGDRRFLENFSTWSRSAIEEVNSYIQEKTGAAMGVQEAARLTKGIPNPGTGLFDGDSPSQFWAKLQGVLKQAKMVEARSLYALRNGLTLMGPTGEPVIPLSAMPKIMDERGAALEVELRRQNPKISPKEMRTQVLRKLGEEFGISSD